MRKGDPLVVANESLDRLASKIAGNGQPSGGRDDAKASPSSPSPEVHNQLMDLVRKQTRILELVAGQPKPRAVVLQTTPDAEDASKVNVVVSYSGIQLEVAAPADMKLAPGNEIGLLNSTLQPADVVENPLGIGDIAMVSRVVDKDKGRCEVLFHGMKRMILTGAYGASLEAGDRVVVDGGCMVVIMNLGKSGNEFEFSGDTKISWDGIIGCVSAKQKLRDAVETPVLRPDVFAHYHDEPPKGILLIGVPGCGKTMLLKAAIHADRAVKGGKSLVLFVSGAALLRGIVGETEELIRQMFIVSRAHFRKTGMRALLVMDEAEALLAKRGSGRSSDVEKTNVPTFLSEMNGVESDGNPLILLATNRPDAMDDAIMRDERMDEVIVVGRPTKEDVPAFFALYLKDTPIDGSPGDMVKCATDEFLSDKYSLAIVKRKSTGVDEHFTLMNVVDGAMLRGIVRRAKALARQRDLKDTKPGDPLGKVAEEDLRAAVEDAFEKRRNVDYREPLMEFVQGFKGDLAESDEVLRALFV